MPVYVDRMSPTQRSRRWPYDSACHLLADTIDELHAFAASLGLKREWYQPRSTPHYDLTSTRRSEAIRRGAEAIDREKVVEIVRKYRAVAR